MSADDKEFSLDHNQKKLLRIALKELAKTIGMYENSLLYCINSDNLDLQPYDSLKYLGSLSVKEEIKSKENFIGVLRRIFFVTERTHVQIFGILTYRLEQTVETYKEAIANTPDDFQSQFLLKTLREPPTILNCNYRIYKRFIDLRKEIISFISKGNFDVDMRRITNAFHVQRERCKALMEEVDFVTKVNLDTSHTYLEYKQIESAVNTAKKGAYIAIFVALVAISSEWYHSSQEISAAHEISEKTIDVKTENNPLSVEVSSAQIKDLK